MSISGVFVRAYKLWERLGQTQTRILACGIGGVAVGAAINAGLPDEEALSRLQGPVQEAHQKAASWVEALNPAKDDQGKDGPGTSQTPTVPSLIPPAGSHPSSLSSLAMSWVTEWCARPDRREVALTFGGGILLDWLMRTACGDGAATAAALAAAVEARGGDMRAAAEEGGADAEEQRQAERALAVLLSSDDGAAALLGRPGVVPRLLRHLASGLAGQDLTQAFMRRALAQGDVMVQRYALQDAATAATPAAAASAAAAAAEVDPSSLGERAAAQVATWRQAGEAWVTDLLQTIDLLRSPARLQESIDFPSLIELSKQPLPQLPLHSPTPGLPISAAQQNTDQEPSLETRRLAAGCLASWAEANDANRAKLMGLGLAGVVANAARDATGRSSSAALELQWELVRIIAALSEGSLPASLHQDSHTPSPTDHQPPSADHQRPSKRQRRQPPRHAAAEHALASCVDPLLFIAADAAVEGDEALAAFALAALAKVAAMGGPPVTTTLDTSNVLPLLHKLATGCGTALRAEVACMVQWLARIGVLREPNDIAQWRDWLLDGLFRQVSNLRQPGGVKYQPEQEDRLVGRDELHAPPEGVHISCCIDALSTLSALPGTPGLAVAHHWLAAMLEQLASRVWPYNAVVHAGVPSPSPSPTASPPSISPSHSRSSFSSWYNWYRGSGGAKGTKAGGAGASSEGGGLSGGKEEEQGTVGSLGPAQMEIGRGANHQQPQQQQLQQQQQVAASSGHHSRDPALLVDAVPVTRAHIKAVARALHEASTVVEAEEPNEPPLDFDPLGAPPLQTHTTKPRASKSRTRPPAERSVEDGRGRAESHEDQATEDLERGDRVAEHDIDAAVAAQCVCDALETLNSVVAADPAKQRWVVASGMLSLLQRLVAQPPAPQGHQPLGQHQQQHQPNQHHHNQHQQQQQPQQQQAWHSGMLTYGAKLTGITGAGQVQPHNLQEVPQLCLRRQAARLLALLALQTCARPRLLSSTLPDPTSVTSHRSRSLAGSGGYITHVATSGSGSDVPVFEGGVGWQWWLQAAAGSEDCWLASHATKALLNLSAVLEGEPQGERNTGGKREFSRSSAAQNTDRKESSGSREEQGQQGSLEDVAGAALEGGEVLGGFSGEHADKGVRGKRGGEKGRVVDTGLCPSPVWGDMVHLLNPQAHHHWVQSSHSNVVPRRCVTAATAPIMGSAVLESMADEHSPFHQHSRSSATDAGVHTHTTATTAADSHSCDGCVYPNSTNTTLTHHPSSSTNEHKRNLRLEPCLAPSSTPSLKTTTSSIAATASAAIESIATTPSSVADTASAAVCSLAEACQALHSTASSFAAPLLLWATPEPADLSEQVVSGPRGARPTHQPFSEPAPRNGKPMALEQHGPQQEQQQQNYSGSQQPRLAHQVFLQNSQQQHQDVQQQQQQQQARASSPSSKYLYSAAERVPPITIQEGNSNSKSVTDTSPEIDVVFVHGMRGGPFITWRKPEYAGGTLTSSGQSAPPSHHPSQAPRPDQHQPHAAGGAQQKDQQQELQQKKQQQEQQQQQQQQASSIPLKLQHLPLKHCWPSDWLAQDFPTARLITVEYLAPMSGWEGESLPLEDTVERVMVQLAAAGVGQRPIVFVAHSMGGLLVKEIIARSLLQEHQPPTAARTAVATAPSIQPASFAASPSPPAATSVAAAVTAGAETSAPGVGAKGISGGGASPSSPQASTAASSPAASHPNFPGTSPPPEGFSVAAASTTSTPAAPPSLVPSDGGQGLSRAAAHQEAQAQSDAGNRPSSASAHANQESQFPSARAHQQGHSTSDTLTAHGQPHNRDGPVGGNAGARSTAHSSTGVPQGGGGGEESSRPHSSSSSNGGSTTEQDGVKFLSDEDRQHAGGLPVSNSLSRMTCGIVFFATPHFGSDVAAMGWRLRHVPYASPAPSLARLTPGPHLTALNQALEGLHANGRIAVISAVEGESTRLAPMLPKWHVVPEASAYPGFGEKLLLPGQDHINCCKPASQSSPSYVAVATLMGRALHFARQPRDDHVEKR